LGRAVKVPALLTLATVILLILTGTREPGAWFSYGLIAFAGYAVLYEYYKGVSARAARGEATLTALRRLFARNQKRYGGYLIHLGVVVIGIGIIGSTVYQQETQETLTPGQSVTLGNMRMVYNEVFEAAADDGRTMIIANVGIYRDGQYMGEVRPRKDIFGERGMPMTIAGQYSTLESDFYILLTNAVGDSVTFKVYLNPLVNLVWWGAIVLLLGTIIAAYPHPERELADKVAEARQPGQLQLAGD
jgi:cytochrome c-type biogenesis protein CcmF